MKGAENTAPRSAAPGDPGDAVTKSYEAALEGWPARLHSLIQANPLFPYSGCLDRDYWHYRAPAAFPSAMFQMGVLALSIAATSVSSAAAQRRWLELTFRALEFWSEMQHSDGTFDEWYRRERSYAATAFSTFAATEAVLLLDDAGHGSFPGRGRVINAAGRAAAWLASRHDPHVSNHSAGGIAALHNAALLTGEDRFSHAAADQLRALASKQHPEGWLPEYRGMDPGYLTVSVGYLAAYAVRGGPPLALEIADRALRAAAIGVNPDGSFGGAFGSRNTAFLMPHGLELLADESPAARWILENTVGHGHHQLVSPANADDRYFAFFFLWSYLWALRARNSRSADSPASQPQVGECPAAGIRRIRTGSWELVTNVFKGAPLRLYRENELILVESGYAARAGRRSWATTQGYHPGEPGPPSQVHTDQISAKARFQKARPENPLDRLSLPFAAYQATVAHMGGIGAHIGDTVKRLLIRRREVFPLTLSREIRVDTNRVEIIDIIQATRAIPRVSLAALTEVTTMHNPSSRFATRPDVGLPPSAARWEGDVARGGTLRRSVVVRVNGDVGDSGLNLA